MSQRYPLKKQGLRRPTVIIWQRCAMPLHVRKKERRRQFPILRIVVSLISNAMLLFLHEGLDHDSSEAVQLTTEPMVMIYLFIAVFQYMLELKSIEDRLSADFMFKCPTK